jgi:hypothetical protein
MMEIVLQPEIPLSQPVLARTLVVPLVYAFDNASINQY